jgi:hypothetical protein
MNTAQLQKASEVLGLSNGVPLFLIYIKNLIHKMFILSVRT